MKFLLVEGIADAKKYYPEISDGIFSQLIALDPTFDPNRDRLGSYGKWILDLYKRGNLKEEDFYKVSSYLTKFDSIKKNLQQRDISGYKNLPDLARVLDDYVEPQQTSGQRLRQLRRDIKHTDLGEEAELVFEDSDWEIWIPKTYNASCKLGRGSHWCTATTEDDAYYNSYTRQGPLYIIINKHNNDEKYQFHFESQSFMDAEDRPIELGDFLSDDRFTSVAEFFRSDFDKMLDLDESGHVTVRLDFEDFADAASSRDMGDRFIMSCLEGDILDYFDYSAEEDLSSIDWRAITSKENLAAIYEKGYSEDDIEAVFSDDGDYEELYSCFSSAVESGAAYGASDDCLKDFYEAVNDLADPKHCDKVEIDLEHEQVKLVFDRTQFLKAIQEYGTWEEGVAAIAKYYVEQYFDFTEPYYGWSGFDEDVYNQRLGDAIEDLSEVF